MLIKINKQQKYTNGNKIISESIVKAIIYKVNEGSTYFHAAESNGVSYRLFCLWVQQGTLDMENDIDSLHSYLTIKLRTSEQDEIIECRQKIKEQKKGHKGCEWTLEHVYWKQFSANASAIDFNDRLTLMEYKNHEEDHSSQKEEVDKKSKTDKKNNTEKNRRKERG